MVSVFYEVFGDLAGWCIACGGALDEVDLCLSESFNVFLSEVVKGAIIYVRMLCLKTLPLGYC